MLPHGYAATTLKLWNRHSVKNNPSKKILLGLDKQQKLWTLPCTHVLTLWFRHSLNWRILLLLSSYFKKQKWLCLEVSPNQIVENETRIYVLCFGLQRKWVEEWLSKFVKDNNGTMSPRCTCLIEDFVLRKRYYYLGYTFRLESST